jgi:hypothetical protein
MSLIPKICKDIGEGKFGAFVLERRKASRLYNDVGYFEKQNACRREHSLFKMPCRFLHLVSSSTNKLGFSSEVFMVYVHW